MGWIDGLIYGLVLVIILLLAFIFLPIFWGSVLVIIYILVGAYLIDPQPIRRKQLLIKTQNKVKLYVII